MRIIYQPLMNHYLLVTAAALFLIHCYVSPLALTAPPILPLVHDYFPDIHRTRRGLPANQFCILYIFETRLDTKLKSYKILRMKHFHVTRISISDLSQYSSDFLFQYSNSSSTLLKDDSPSSNSLITTTSMRITTRLPSLSDTRPEFTTACHIKNRFINTRTKKLLSDIPASLDINVYVVSSKQ